VTFMQSMQQSNSAANATLHQNFQDSIEATRRATEAHATAIAQEMAMHSRKQDQRDAVVDQLRQSLAQAHQTPSSVPIPPAPSTQEVHHIYHQHQADLRPTVPQSTGTDPALMQLLAAGRVQSDQRHNAHEVALQLQGATLGNAIRHMQSSGAGLEQILLHLKGQRGEIEVAASSSSGPPPPPPGAGAIMARQATSSSGRDTVPYSSGGRPKTRRKPPDHEGSPKPPAAAVPVPDTPAPPPFFQNFGTGFVAPVIKPGIRPRLSSRPFDAGGPSIAGGKRKEPNQPSILRKPTPPERTDPLQPKGPHIPERFDIAKDDEAKPQKRKNFGLSIHQLAKRMADNRRSAKRRSQPEPAASSTDPWEHLYGDESKFDVPAVREARFRKAVKDLEGSKGQLKIKRRTPKVRAAT
jgi:hypothetical protein